MAASLEAKLHKKLGGKLAKASPQNDAQQQEEGYQPQPQLNDTSLSTGQKHGTGRSGTAGTGPWDRADVSTQLAKLSINMPTDPIAPTMSNSKSQHLPTSSPLRDFKHHPLKPVNGVDQIRLLTILPDAQLALSGSTSPLRIKLYHTSLKREMRSFTALSYSWGNATDLVTIWCNDQPLKITRSLYNFLRAVRNRKSSSSSSGEEPPTYIWADAICINQQDSAEKNYQVPLMRNIYRRARRVLVWLGDAARDSELALPILPLLATAAEKQRAGLAHPTQVVALQREDWLRMGFAMPEAEAHLRLRAYYRFLRREWFRRVWAVQEYALGRSVTFLCGSGEFSEDELVRATMFTSESQMDTTIGRLVEPVMMPLHSVRAEMRAAKKVPLMSLLKRYQGFDATKPKDKVFSLLGLASDSGSEMNGLSITVDYDASDRSVYLQVARQLILRDRNLEIVTLAGTYTPMIRPGANETQPRIRQRLAGLPSWVPDWSVPDATCSIQQHFERGHQNRSLLSSSTHTEQTGRSSGTGPQYIDTGALTEFRASGTSIYTPDTPLLLRGKLLVRCHFLDAITAVGTPNNAAPAIPDDWDTMKIDTEDYDEALRMLDVFGNWVEVLGVYKETNRYFTGESMLDVLWQSMLCGHHVHGVENERAVFMEWYRATFKLRMQAEQLQSKPRAWKQAYDAYKEAQGGSGASMSFMAMASAGMSNRGVFRAGGGGLGRGLSGLKSSSSGYAGMAPAGSHVGDWVGIIEGASVPMILRRKGLGNEWEVVGACYAHGCMSGQIFDSSKCQEIVLL